MYTFQTLDSIAAHNNLNPYAVENIKDCKKSKKVKTTAISYSNLEKEFQSQACAQNQMKIQSKKTRISKNGKEHDAIEDWLGRHNRKFEILRTLTSVISASASSIVLLKLFGAI
jgi:hypothetical protein